ncbi:peptidoglycan-binding protein LysM [Tenacibaculum amylolyticum]|uniref:peptidoglycan-binding protein LysM n=1 Tax=Tenacibaculum amylolyticum TaxID=104269 RepID=UPI0038B63242
MLIIRNLGLLLIFITLSSFTKEKGKLIDKTTPINYVTSKDVLILEKDFIGFKEALAFKESQGKYTVVNSLGYLGKYQFGKGTLRRFKIYDTQKFLKTPELQERAFTALCKVNKWILRRDISRFVGKRINGITITESGILAAAHLAGAGNVKKFLRSYGKFQFKDSFGTSIESYMKKFSGYDVSYIKADKKATV